MAESRLLPMFPLSTVLFPGAPLALQVFEPRYRQMLSDCLDGDRRFGVVLISRGSEVGGGDIRTGVGTTAAIAAVEPLSAGRIGLVTTGEGRIRVSSWIPDDPYPKAQVLSYPDEGDEPPVALRERARRALVRSRALASEAGRAPALELPGSAGVWDLCQEAPLGSFDRQRLLEAPDAHQRLELLATLCDAVADDLRRLLGAPPPAEDR